MDFASIQTQLANLTSQLLQYAEKTTMHSAPTFDASYRQGYQANQYPQRDWSDHSTSMCSSQGPFPMKFLPEHFAFGAARLPQDAVQAFADIAKALGKTDWDFSGDADPCSGQLLSLSDYF